jgi:hypothetical protein
VFIEECVAISFVEHQMNYRHVLFYMRVTFLKKTSHKSNTKSPFKAAYFLWVRRLTT